MYISAVHPAAHPALGKVVRVCVGVVEVTTSHLTVLERFWRCLVRARTNMNETVYHTKETVYHGYNSCEMFDYR